MVHRGARCSTDGAGRLTRRRMVDSYEPDEPEPEDEDPDDPLDDVPLSVDVETLVSLELVPGVEALPLPPSLDDFFA